MLSTTTRCRGRGEALYLHTDIAIQDEVKRHCRCLPQKRKEGVKRGRNVNQAMVRLAILHVGKGNNGKRQENKEEKGKGRTFKNVPRHDTTKITYGLHGFVTQDISRIRACDIIQENVPFSASAIMMLRSLHMHFCLLFLPRPDTHF